MRTPKLDDLPFYYQQLGRACADLGLVDEFYLLVEVGYDFGRAFPTICGYIQHETGETLHEVREWLRYKYEIDLYPEDIVDDMGPKW